MHWEGNNVTIYVSLCFIRIWYRDVGTWCMIHNSCVFIYKV